MYSDGWGFFRGDDFSNAKSAKGVPALARLQKANEGKERITIRLDADVLAWFRDQVKGGGNYQSLINEALRMHISERDGTLERTLRKVIREELRTAA
ncbi:BrnA antitoxin family protein [Polycyclovorans algicola]|uniref:BrnA antitoxin family protein n=1 Tax=Polycyclovorans algicola TaxID=616992 RepID=UPI00344B93CD